MHGFKNPAELANLKLAGWGDNIQPENFVETKQIYIAALDLFNWKLQPEVPSYYMEQSLLRNGNMACFNTEELGLVFTSFTYSGINMYGEPTNVTPLFYVNSTPTPLTVIDYVYMWDNPTKTPLQSLLMLYEKMLAEIRQTIMIDMKLLRIPKLIAADEADFPQYLSVFEKVEQGAPLIKTKTSFNAAQAQLLDLEFDTTYLETAWNTYFKIRNEAYNLLGIIYNAAAGRLSGVSVAEVGAENSSVFVISDARFRLREQFVESVNSVYNTNFSVKPTHSREWQLNQKKLQDSELNDTIVGKEEEEEE